MTENGSKDADDGNLRRWRSTPAGTGTEVNMLCAELEDLEAQFDKIVAALENPNLTEQERLALLKARDEMSHTIKDHQTFGHKGAPCFEE
ncbi:MAG TPA: hypothetical protein VLW83_01245 [Candidatus Acidoferrales bacterium]|nr:hypothetical protein [Candidatus Acidoferrales bacterium]